jgi:hypothetical protein
MRLTPGVAMMTCSKWKGGKKEPAPKTRRKRKILRIVTTTFFMGGLWKRV